MNCLHIIPDLKRLEAKYSKELVVVGVHSAKFLGEKETDNIREAILKHDLEHPVLNDRDFAYWNAFGVSAWPTVVLIDPSGNVVGGQSGEGIYDVFDKAIGDVVREFDAKKGLNRKPIRFVLEKEGRPKSVLSYPSKIVGDAASGRLFFSDTNHNRIVISSLTGEIKEVIGQGGIGLKDGDFTTAQFFRPQGVWFDATENALYIADTENNAIRRVDLGAKKVTTIAGTGKQSEIYPPREGPGATTALKSPWDVLKLGPTLYIAMAGTHQLWSYNVSSKVVGPYAGNAGENITDGPLASAQLAQPSGLATDGKKLFFADTEVSAVRTADLGGTGSVETIIGTGLFDFGDVDGKYPEARLQHPVAVAERGGLIYVADTYNHKIKRIDPKTRTLTTEVGTGKRGMTDGPALLATLNEPNGLYWVGDKLYIADTNNHVLRVYDPATKAISTIKLTGIEKLAVQSMPEFVGNKLTLSLQTVAPTATALEVRIELPAGTKFNPNAPFSLSASSDVPGVVAAPTTAVTKGAAIINIPVTLKPGQATITVDMTINYCNSGNEGLCYFKQVKVVVPVKVAAGGAATIAVPVKIAARALPK